ncbi:MAG: DUF3293 domain-containing protein [Cyanobacteria bacterium P01_G01_bin.19]
MFSQPQFTQKEIADLEQAYRDAVYGVYYYEQTIQLLIDRLSPKLDFILTKHHSTTWALITAHNPYSQCLSPAENQQRHQDLVELLRSHNLTFFNAIGKDKDDLWTPEQSIFIVGIELEKAISIGNKFQQNAIVVGEWGQRSKLIWLVG